MDAFHHLHYLLFNIFLEFVMEKIESISDESLFTDENLLMNVKYTGNTSRKNKY